jgi:hypothetical protein
MSSTPSTPPAPRPHATGVRAWLRAALEAWLLTWLVRRLPAGYRRMLERGDELPPSFVAAFAPDAPVYAAAVALGFLPDWILPGIRNRGMRSTPGLHLLPCRRSARAPPADRACHTNPSLHRPMKNGPMRAGMSLCLARRHQPARRAIPTPAIAGRVGDCRGWYHPFLQSAPPWGRPGRRRYHCKNGSLR